MNFFTFIILLFLILIFFLLILFKLIKFYIACKKSILNLIQIENESWSDLFYAKIRIYLSVIIILGCILLIK